MQANKTGIRQNFAGYRRRWDDAKVKKSVVFWIAFGAIVITLVFGFTRGGWTTEGNALKLAETSAQSALVERLTPICVAQFNADPQQASKLTELLAVSSTSKRITYVKDQGWATMPGETSPDNKIAGECTKQLMLIAK